MAPRQAQATHIILFETTKTKSKTLFPSTFCPTYINFNHTSQTSNNRYQVQEHMKFAGRKDQSLDFHAFCSPYAVMDVAFITSLRDGMNLVSYEFVACQASKKVILILSEFAGAAQSLGAGATLVDPWNITEVAASIKYALDMPADERGKRHQHNFKNVTTHISQERAATFVRTLVNTTCGWQQKRGMDDNCAIGLG